MATRVNVFTFLKNRKFNLPPVQGKNATGYTDTTSACVKTRWVKTFQFVLKTRNYNYIIERKKLNILVLSTLLCNIYYQILPNSNCIRKENVNYYVQYMVLILDGNSLHVARRKMGLFG